MWGDIYHLNITIFACISDKYTNLPVSKFQFPLEYWRCQYLVLGSITPKYLREPLRFNISLILGDKKGNNKDDSHVGCLNHKLGCITVCTVT